MKINNSIYLPNLIASSQLQNNLFFNYTQFTPSNSGGLLTANVACFVFMGVVQQNFIPLKLYFPYSTAPTGSASHALGFFSTPTIPAAANQVMTPLITTSSLTLDTSATNSATNTTNFSTVILAGTNLWAAYISNYSATQMRPVNQTLYSPFGSLQTVTTTISTFIGGGTLSASISNGRNTLIYPCAYMTF